MKSALSLNLSVCLAGTALPASAQEPAGADQARHVAIHVIGQPVTVKLSSSATVRGQIRDIADDYFVLLLDGTGAPVNIAYRDACGSSGPFFNQYRGRDPTESGS